MVANQSTSASKLNFKLEDLSKVLTKLQFDKKGKKSKNQSEWDESLRTVLATADLTYFIGKFSGLVAPTEQVAELFLKRQAQEYAIDARNKRMKMQKLKQESMKVGTQSVDEKSISSSLSQVQEDNKKFEEFLESQVQKILKDNRESRELAVKRGVRAETVFLNPFTRIPKQFSHVNPEATVEVEEEGDLFLYEIEDQKIRFKRFVAWQLLVTSIKEVDKALWKHIPVGNVFALYSLLTTNFLDTERPDVMAKLTAEFIGLNKSEDELFVNFLSRYEALLVKVKEINWEIDPDSLYNYVEQALNQSDSLTQEVFDQLSIQCERFKTPDELLKKMASLMKKREKKEREETEFIVVSSKKDKKKDELARARALVAAADKNSQSKNSVKGICIYFQHDKCLKGEECKFQHKKLSKQDAEKLEKLVSNSNKAKQAKSKAAIATSNENDTEPAKASVKHSKVGTIDFMKMVSDLSTNMSDKQMESFAKAIVKQVSDSKEKEE